MHFVFFSSFMSPLFYAFCAHNHPQNLITSCKCEIFFVPLHSNLSLIPTVKRQSTDSQPTVKAYVTHLFNPYKNHIISYGYAAIYYYI